MKSVVIFRWENMDYIAANHPAERVHFALDEYFSLSVATMQKNASHSGCLQLQVKYHVIVNSLTRVCFFTAFLDCEWKKGT